MIDRDINPDNRHAPVSLWSRDRRDMSNGEQDAALERAEFRHDEGEDRRGRWGLR